MKTLTEMANAKLVGFDTILELRINSRDVYLLLPFLRKFSPTDDKPQPWATVGMMVVEDDTVAVGQVVTHWRSKRVTVYSLSDGREVTQ